MYNGGLCNSRLHACSTLAILCSKVQLWLSHRTAHLISSGSFVLARQQLCNCFGFCRLHLLSLVLECFDQYTYYKLEDENIHRLTNNDMAPQSPSSGCVTVYHRMGLLQTLLGWHHRETGSTQAKLGWLGLFCALSGAPNWPTCFDSGPLRRAQVRCAYTMYSVLCT